MRSILIAATLIVASLLSVGIHGHKAYAADTAADADAACQTKDELAANIIGHAPPTLAVEQLADVTGPNAIILAKAFDALPPAGETQADEVLIFHALYRETGQEHPQWVVALFFKGCKQAAALVPSATFKSAVGMGV